MRPDDRLRTPSALDRCGRLATTVVVPGRRSRRSNRLRDHTRPRTDHDRGRRSVVRRADQDGCDSRRHHVAVRGAAPVHDAHRRGTASGRFSGSRAGSGCLEITARDHLPHVLVVPIYLMLQPEPVPWDTSLSLQPVTAVHPEPEPPPDQPACCSTPPTWRPQASGCRRKESLLKLGESSLDARALCAAGDIALLIREAEPGAPVLRAGRSRRQQVVSPATRHRLGGDDGVRFRSRHQGIRRRAQRQQQAPRTHALARGEGHPADPDDWTVGGGAGCWV